MKLDKYNILLIILFIIVLASRLIISLGAPTFSEESYQHLRLAEHIAETGLPLYSDSLSYGGRQYYYPPLFHYLLAAFSFIIPLELVGKILPSILFSTLVFLVFGIANNITNDRKYSLLASLFFAFTPISFIHPLASVTPYSLAIPLFFLSVYFLTKGRSRIDCIIGAIIALVFTHASAFLLVVGLLSYLLLMQLEGVKIDSQNKEITLFTIFFSFWVLFILYKKMFLTQGLGAIWQNYPLELIEVAFTSLDIFQIIYLIGMVPLFLGVMGIFTTVFRESRQDLLLLLGITVGVAVLSWLNFLNLNTAMLFMSVLLSIFAAQGMKSRSTYMRRTIFAKLSEYKVFSLVFLFVISQVVPLYGTAVQDIESNPDPEVIEALKWLEENSNPDDTVLAPLSEGHLVTYFAQRKNVMDRNFITIPDINQRFRDLERAYTVRLESRAIQTLEKYSVDYIFHSPLAQEKYGDLYYVNNECFTKVYNQSTEIYRLECSVVKE